MFRQLFAAAAVLSCMATQAQGQEVRLEGYFIALETCEANKKKDTDNPGDVRLQKLHAYKTLSRNSTPGTHYRIEVPGAPESTARWVTMTCGAFAPKDSLIVADGAIQPQPSPSPGTTLAPGSIENVLAASWQPGFCATRRGRDKPECRSQTGARFDATHFSIHGLWPDDLDNTQIFPCYCDRGAPVSCRRRFDAVSNIDLSTELRARLNKVMPGTQSNLHLHEWTKHGTCYEDDRTGPDAGATPEEYYADTIALLDQLNRSVVRDLFTQNLGQFVSRAQIAAAFDSAFGQGAGERVYVVCRDVDRQNVITELWIGLKGNITPQSDLASLILAAPTTETSSSHEMCNGGIVVKAKDS